jgi:hypothetical protein
VIAVAEPDRWERWSPISGIVFVLLFVFVFLGGEPPQDATGEELARFYQEQGEGKAILGFFLIGVAAAALLWFTGSLRAALWRVEPPPSRLSAIAFGGGVATAVLLMVGGATFLSPVVVAFEEIPSLDPVLHDVVSSAGFIAINFALLSSAVMITAASIVALRWGGFPKWFVWLSFLVALALVLNILYFFGFFLWLAWVLLASILLLVRPVGRAPATG